MAQAGSGLPVNLMADYLTLVDDAAFAPGTSRVMMAGAEFDDVTPDAVNEGDAGALRMSANRNLYVNIRDNAGNERGLNVDAAGAIAVTDGTGSLTVDNAGTFAVQATQAGTWNITNLSGTVSLPTGASTLAEQQTQTTALQLIDDAVHAPNGAINKAMAIGGQLDDTGTTAATENNVSALRITAQRALHINLRDSAGAEITTLPVSLASVPSHNVTNAGTFAVQNTAATPAGTNNIGDVDVLTLPGIAGDVAHDGADSGNPVKMGAVARQTNPTAVADGDRVNVFADDLGRQVMAPFAPRDRIVKGARISLTSTTETTLIAAGAAGVFRDLVWVELTNESATQVRADIRDATGGTVQFSITLAASAGGVTMALPVVWPQATAANNWTVQLSGAVTTVYASALAVENN